MKIPTTILSLFLLALLAIAGCKNNPSTDQASMLPRGAQADHLDRFEQEIQVYEQADKAKMPPQNAVLFVGSSSIRLWANLEKDFAPLPVINRGFGGSTIPEVSYYADRIIWKYRPKVMVLYCGENDVAESTPPVVVFQNFKKFIGETEKNLPAAKVLVISCKPSPQRWHLWKEVQQLNNMFSQFATGRPNLRYVEISQTLLGPDGKPDPSLFVEDQLHLNGSGYERWTALLKPMLVELYEGKVAQ